MSTYDFFLHKIEYLQVQVQMKRKQILMNLYSFEAEKKSQTITKLTDHDEIKIIMLLQGLE